MSVLRFKVLHEEYAFIDNGNPDHGPVSVKAVVRAYEGSEKLQIVYSHTCQPSETAGPWYSDSASSANDLNGAKATIKGWFMTLENSFKILPWSEDI